MKKILKQYEKRVWNNAKDEKLNYRFRKPNNCNPNKKYPILFFLHGAGGRGSNNKDQILDAGSINAFTKQGIFNKHDSYLLAAQVPNNEKWVNVDWGSLEHTMPKISKTMFLAFELLDDTLIKNNIDINRIYVVGISMGGFGVWDALQRRPNFFAAGIPICGGGDIKQSKSISHIPIWIWHGSQDAVINVKRSRDMYNSIKQFTHKIKFTEIKDRGHNVWIDAWNSKNLWNWLYLQSL